MCASVQSRLSPLALVCITHDYTSSLPGREQLMADDQNIEKLDEIEEIAPEVSVDDMEVDEDIPMSEEEAWAYKIIKRAATLKGVTINRETFLRTELSKKCPPDMVKAAVETNPQAAGVPMQVMDELADAAISIETRKVSGLSALAGLPGGLAMVGTIPADVVQYFAHSLRIEQKLAYIYGWESFLNDEDEIDDETMYRLILFLGVMVQVGSVNVSLTKFAAQTAKVGVAKAIQKQALTKTFWYVPLKKVLRVVGVNVTKKSFAEAVAKGVPVVGGVVSGGLTYATFRPSAVSLKKHLRALPQATGVVLSEEEMEAVLEQIDEETTADYRAALAAAGEKAAEVANVAKDKAAVVADVAKDKANVAAKAAASGIRKGFGGLSARINKARSRGKAGDAAPVADDIVTQLQAYKTMLDDGLITQDDYDAKKKELLGL